MHPHFPSDALRPAMSTCNVDGGGGGVSQKTWVRTRRRHLVALRQTSISTTSAHPHFLANPTTQPSDVRAVCIPSEAWVPMNMCAGRVRPKMCQYATCRPLPAAPLWLSQDSPVSLGRHCHSNITCVFEHHKTATQVFAAIVRGMFGSPTLNFPNTDLNWVAK